MFRFFHVTKAYPGEKGIYDISFDAVPGQAVLLYGRNGCGKSTILRIIARLKEPDQGILLWKGASLEKLPLRICGYLPEEKALFAESSVLEFLKMMGRIRQVSSECVSRRIKSIAEQFEMENIKSLPIKKLSKGNAQIVSFMASVIHEPALLLLDEPMSGLDPQRQKIMAGIIRDYARNHVVIVSTHQEWLWETVKGKKITLDKGRIMNEETIE